MEKKDIIRKVAALGLCILLTFLALCVWDSALVIEDRYAIGHVWSDISVAVLFAAAIFCSALFTKEDGR